jgi:membrane protein DedA with SNARE-associated domain
MFNLIAGALQKTGIFGVFLLMLVENLIPVIPSELIMPMAGYEAARGSLDPVLTVLAGAVGSIIGGLLWYRLGYALGLERATHWAERHGRWVTLSAKDVARGVAWFDRWGAAAVCLGRMCPGVRGVICFPAGVAQMPFARFLLWSSIGATLWSALLVAGGYALKARFTVVGQWINPVSDSVLVICLLIYAVRLLRRRKPAA